jgi:ATP-dependent DNA helicase 2 subunit 1
MFSLPFEIGPGLNIGVKGYLLIKREKPIRTTYVWVGGDKVQIAVGSTTQLADDTARTVEKGEIRKAYKFGGETITFSEEELKKIKNFGDPVIKLIGFKNMDLLPIWASVRAPYFIYPSETDFVGSTRVFSALQQKMLKANKFGLVWFIPRKNATPVLAAAVAGEEKYSDEGEQLTPPGIWIIPLPFADDIRQKPDSTMIRAPDSLVDLMRVVIQQLHLPKGQYDPKKYPNPCKFIPHAFEVRRHIC